MKNLKKVLALVMAFTMSLSMLASATFTDSAEIKATEAVDLLSALGIIKGNPDGSFAPDKVVTRAEMAKMIFVIKNGGREDADAFSGAATTFTDINGHWAANYIKYAYTSGIIAGKSATTFAPDAPVTAQEAAKMVLVLLGYDAKKAGLVGTQWAITTTALATEKGLFDNYPVNIAQGAPRQYAAQLLSNGLSARVVTLKDGNYEEVYTSTVSGGQTQLNYITLGEKAMGLRSYVGTFIGNDKYSEGSSVAKGQIAVKGTDSTTANATFVMPNNLDWIGEEVKVLYKETADSKSNNTLDTGDKVYGVTNTGRTKVVNTTLGGLEDADTNKIKVAGTQYDVVTTNKIDVVNNFGAKATVVDVPVAQFDKNPAGTYAIKSGDKIKFTSNKDGRINKAYIVATTFHKVAAVNADTINIIGKGTMKKVNNKFYDGIAKDDIVSVTTYYDSNVTDDTSYSVVEKAEVVTEVLTAIRSDNEIKLGTGEFIAKSVQPSNGTGFTKDVFEANDLGNTFKVIKSGNYWVRAEQTSESVKDVATILAVEGDRTASSFNGMKVRILKADGTEVVYKVHKDSKLSDSDTTVGKLVAYSITSDNQIKLNTLETVANKTGVHAVPGVATYRDTTKSLSFSGVEKLVDSSAVAFIEHDKSSTDKTRVWSVLKLNDLKAFASQTGTAFYSLNSSGNITAITAQVSGVKPSGAISTSSYGFATNQPDVLLENGNQFTNVSVWNGTEQVTLKIEGNETANVAIAKGSMFKYDISSNGTANIIEKVSTTDNATTKTVKAKLYDATRRIIETSNSIYQVSKDVKIIYIDSRNDKAGSDIGINGYDEVTQKPNVTLVLNNSVDMVVEAMFVDINNDITQ